MNFLRKPLKNLRSQIDEKLLWPFQRNKGHVFIASNYRIEMKTPSLRALKLMRSHYLTTAYFEDQELYLKAAGFERGTTILDIGANIGYVSIPYALLCPLSRVLAFEASALNFKHLKLNCLKYPVIEAFQVGVHHENGEAFLSMPSESQNPKINIPDQHSNTGLLSLYGEGKRLAEKVILRPLDDLIAQYGGGRKIGLIKIDVEGNELNVLKGAAKTLSKDRPILHIEINPSALKMAGINYAMIKNFLESRGYRAFHYKDGEILPFSGEVVDAMDLTFKIDFPDKTS